MKIDPNFLKQSALLTGDVSSLKSFVRANHLPERARKIILSKIDNNESYLNGYFIFTDDGYYYSIKPPYDFYKFDTLDELISYLIEKYKKYKDNLSTYDVSKENQERILVRINNFFEHSIGNLVSYNNYLDRQRYNFSSGIGMMGYIPNFHNFKKVFYENAKIKKYLVMDCYYSPFSFKGYDFSFEYDHHEGKLYLRYVTSEDDDYENHSVSIDGTIKEIIEFFYDSYPNILDSVLNIYEIAK